MPDLQPPPIWKPYCTFHCPSFLSRPFALAYMLHFLLPFILAALSATHLLFLHETGSSNPLGLDRNFDKRPFHPYFSVKDVFGFIIFFLLLTFLCLQAPWDLGDPENFIPANPMVTPVHIQPE